LPSLKAAAATAAAAAAVTAEAFLLNTYAPVDAPVTAAAVVDSLPGTAAGFLRLEEGAAAACFSTNPPLSITALLLFVEQIAEKAKRGSRV
jgi:hypothetical protein